MKSIILSLFLILAASSVYAQGVSITNIAARSRVAIGVSRVWDVQDKLQLNSYAHDEAILVYNFKVVPHLYLSSSVAYAFNGDQVSPWRYVVGVRFPIGAAK